MHRLRWPGFGALFLRLSSRNAALLAAFIVAASVLHVALVVASANPIPYSDEWDAVIAGVLRPAATGHLGLWDFFRPHNEHTMAPTIVVAVVALWLNQWQFDNVPVALLNALLYALAMAVPILLFFRHAVSRAACAFAFVLAVAALVPIEGGDLIFGFQNQYYFLIAGSVLTMWFAASATASRWRSLAAFAATAAVTCVSMGSGFFASVFALAILALRRRREPEQRRQLGWRMLIAGVFALLGLILLLHSFAVMKAAGNIGQKHIDLDGIRRVLSCLAWPYGASAWLGLLLALPFAAFALGVLWRPAATASLDYLALAMGAWAAAQIGALAFDRDIDALSLASRYLPVMLFWPAMNLYAVFRLSETFGARRAGRAALAAAFVPILASGIFVSNVVKLAPASLDAMALAGREHQMQAANMQRYVRGHDRDALYGAGHMGLPYPNPARLQSLLDDPVIRAGLPANIRAPMPLAADAATPTTFVAFGAYKTVPARADVATIGSYGDAGDATTGRFVSPLLHSAYPFLRIDLAGYLPDEGLSLNLDCAPTPACRPTQARPADFARETWQGLYLRVPQTEFRLVADDESNNRWFAFTAPIEVGRLSFATDLLLQQLRANRYTWLALTAGVLVMLLMIGAGPRAGVAPVDAGRA